jgi:hypothetical protein
MKNIVIIFLFAILISINANANEKKTNHQEILKDNIISTNSFNHFTFIEDNNTEGCEISGTVYLPTPYGIFKLKLAIVADTCEEASAGVKQAIKGFLAEIF